MEEVRKRIEETAKKLMELETEASEAAITVIKEAMEEKEHE